jgi:hypothetical protein
MIRSVTRFIAIAAMATSVMVACGSSDSTESVATPSPTATQAATPVTSGGTTVDLPANWGGPTYVIFGDLVKAVPDEYVVGEAVTDTQEFPDLEATPELFTQLVAGDYHVNLQSGEPVGTMRLVGVIPSTSATPADEQAFIENLADGNPVQQMQIGDQQWTTWTSATTGSPIYATMTGNPVDGVFIVLVTGPVPDDVLAFVTAYQFS